MGVMRRLLLLLVAANLLLLLWNLVRPVVDQSERPPVSGLLGSPSELVHISEHSAPLQSRYPSVSDESEPGQNLSASGSAALLQQSCQVFGSFASEEAARTVMADSGIVFSVMGSRGLVADSPLYRVMIPPSANREAALQQLAEVRLAIGRIGGGIDTYLVTSGPIANAVSLGVFSEQSNAINVRTVLAREGVDAVIEQENRAEMRYWVVIKDSEAFEFVSENMVLRGLGMAPDELSENLCETIAQAE